MSALMYQPDWDVRVRVRVRVKTLLCYCFLLKTKFEWFSKTSVKNVRCTVFEQTSDAEALDLPGLMCQV